MPPGDHRGSYRAGWLQNNHPRAARQANGFMTRQFFQTRLKFLQASQQRFTDWGEADNYRRVGGALDEFHDLFVLITSYYQRRRWTSKAKPIWYRQSQLSNDRCDRWFGHTPYGRMFSPFSKYRQDTPRPARKSKRRFRSRHLIGKFRSSGSSNAAIRAAMA